MHHKQLFLISFFLLSFLQISAQDIYFDHIGNNTSIGNVIEKSICQDKNGLIWVGSTFGLFSYDGINLKQHYPLDLKRGLSKNCRVIMLSKGFDDKLYMLADGKIVSYDLLIEKFKTISTRNYSALCSGTNTIWASIKNELYSIRNNKTTFYYKFEPDLEISVIYENKDNKLYIGTQKNGVFVIDKNMKTSHILNIENPIFDIYEDQRKNIWIGTGEEGVFRINPTNQITNYKHNALNSSSLCNNFVRTICEDDFGNLWFGTINGLDNFSTNTNLFSHYGQSDSKYFGLTNSSVWSLFKDRQGTIWIGTYFGGVCKFNPQYENFTYHLINNLQTDQPTMMGQIVKDKNGNYWIATEGKGLIYYNKEKKESYVIKSSSQKGLTSNNVKNLYYDSKTDVLWILTHLGGLCRFDLNKNKITHIIDKKHPEFSNFSFLSICPYGNKFFISSMKGLYIFDPLSQSFTHFSAISSDSYHSILMDNDSNLWVGGANHKLLKINLKNNKIKKYQSIEGDNYSFKGRVVSTLFKDHKGEMWIGTEDDGLFRYNKTSDAFIHYRFNDSEIEGHFIFKINETQNGYLLLATEKGLTQLDVENNKCYNYNYQYGFPLISMAPGGIFVEKSGEIFLSGTNGLFSLKDDKLLLPPQKIHLRFSTLKINNEIINPNEKNGILSESLFATRKIILNDNQSVIQIAFSSDNYILANAYNYQYILEGFDQNWTNASPDQQIGYMNLQPGNYTLKVRGINKNHPKESAEISLEIKILHPIYQTWYAYLFYFIVIGLLTRWIFKFYHSRMLLKSSLMIEREEKEQIEQANQSKLRFFTNISHEFRTPITLILGQLQLLMESSSIHPTLYTRVLNIYKNASKMQYLISELLDFRKQEQGFLKLKISRQNVVNFVFEIHNSFVEYAKFREIEFSFESNVENINVWFDSVQFQKVIFNLISNAFKYTEKKGNILVLLDKAEKSVFIHVKDTGIGIPEETLERIFDNFYQVENFSQNSTTNLSSGIGLALAKGIVEAHHGEIKVKTQVNLGSDFIIEIPLGDTHFADNDFVSKIETPNADLLCLNELKQEVPIISSELKESFADTTLLIVEDNKELQAMLSQIFEPFFNVILANNGFEGFNTAKKKQPDLIVSDVMMPIMSGNEMCAKLKTDSDTNHIPIILLTALITVEQSIEGLKNGADDYITKPFNVQMLITRCVNLLKGRKVLKEKYLNQLSQLPYVEAINNIDQNFIDNAIRIIEENIENEDFDVKIFASEMNLGLTTFYAKLKAITGQTPNEFIVMIKLRKAAALIQHRKEMNISEIAYSIGFSNPKYFAKCFRNQYGLSPIAYRKSEK